MAFVTIEKGVVCFLTQLEWFNLSDLSDCLKNRDAVERLVRG